MKTVRQLKAIVHGALKSEYGFAPALINIRIMESNDTGTYIAFTVNGKYYRFDSYKLPDGTIWVGKGTIEKMPQYDIV